MTDLDPTRQRLLDAAGPIFAEKGYKATSVRDITDRAGVNVSAVNYYFRSKEQLYLETVRMAFQSIELSAPLPPVSPAMPAAQRLRGFVRGFLTRLLTEHGPRWRRDLLLREVGEPTVACAHLVREFVRPMFDALMSILADLLPPDVPEMKRHLLVCSIIGQCLHYHHSRHILPHLIDEAERRLHTVDLLADHIAEFSLAALTRLYPARKHGAKT